MWGSDFVPLFYRWNIACAHCDTAREVTFKIHFLMWVCKHSLANTAILAFPSKINKRKFSIEARKLNKAKK
jgi:hypothetical protein